MTTAGGEISEKSGRPKPRRNRDIGPPVGPDRSRNQRLALEWFESLAAEEVKQVRNISDLPFRSLVGDYLTEMRDKIAERTLASHDERLMTFLAFRTGRGILADRPIRDLKQGDVDQFVRSKLSEGCSPVYINSILISVYACLNWASRPIDGRDPLRYLGSNPFHGFKRPKTPAPEKRYAGAVAHRAFFEYAINRACLRHRTDSLGWRFDRLAIALFRFCQATGCRPSEACRLEWSHIDWDESMAVMFGKTTGKTGEKRTIPIPSETIAMIRKIEKLPGHHPRFVFTHARRDQVPDAAERLAGIPWVVNALDHKFRAWRDEAIAIGCPIENTGNSALTLYALRRDLGAEIFRLRGSHADSAEVLGHSAAMNAKHYASFAKDHALSLAEQVSRARKRRRITEDPTS